MAVVQSILERKFPFMCCHPCLLSTLIRRYHHTRICNMYYLKRNGQHIIKPSYKIQGGTWLTIYTYSSYIYEILWKHYFGMRSKHWTYWSVSNFLCHLFVLCRDGKVHPLAFIHHTSTYQASLCKLIEYWWEHDQDARLFISPIFIGLFFFNKELLLFGTV